MLQGLLRQVREVIVSRLALKALVQVIKYLSSWRTRSSRFDDRAVDPYCARGQGNGRSLNCGRDFTSGQPVVSLGIDGESRNRSANA